MSSLTLIHLTETAITNCIVDFYRKKMQKSNLGWTRYTQQHASK